MSGTAEPVKGGASGLRIVRGVGGTGGDPDEKGYELVTGRMQDAPSVLGGARALPLIG